MIVNADTLLMMSPIIGMETEKHREYGVSYGLGEAGYDIRIKQEVSFRKFLWLFPQTKVGALGKWKFGRFCLTSAIEEFCVPFNMVGIVHDKSTWARHGLSVFNTVVEPGWKGFLTLELVYHGQSELHIPAGAGIAQVIFHQTTDVAAYGGKYQNQKDEPVAAIMEREHQGPVAIIDVNGVHPSALDRAIKEQKAYYEVDQSDPTKRGFTPK